MPKKYIVDLTEAEQETLHRIVKTGKHAADKINHARILLKANINQAHGVHKDSEIASFLDLSIPTIERVRKRFVEEGLDSALSYRPGRGRKTKCLDGDREAHLLALACSEPPEGQAKWTLRLLADKMVELNYVKSSKVKSISPETVRLSLKKMNSNHGRRNVG